ncbi:MAG: hypothetical protein AAFU57_16665 [Bacteroidota bacterium]
MTSAGNLFRHPELDSGSFSNEYKMLNQVQHDRISLHHPERIARPSGGVSGSFLINSNRSSLNP